MPTTDYTHSDAMGQQDSADYNSGAAGQTYRYDRRTDRLLRTFAWGGQAVDSTVYDASGNVTQTFRAWVPPEYSGCTYPYVSEAYTRWYSYDQHVDSVQKTTTADPGCIRSEYFDSFDHFRYDALGRRVLTRSYGNATTSNSIERYTWDGNELFTETHYPGAVGTPDSTLENDYNPITIHLSCEEVHPHDCGWSPEDTLFMTLPDSTPYVGGYGRISYVHGAELDRPMAVIRENYGSDSVLVPPFAVMPHYDWRGLADIGTYSGGYTSYTYWGVLIQIDFFAPQETMHMMRFVASVPHGWFGSLLAEQRTPAGDMYMRNRYYDPMQGRFTQEDPIGIGGGLNLYGFAGGDPVNFADPFGLSPCSDLRTNIDETNHDYMKRSIRYLLYGLIGMHDTGHYRALQSTRDRLRNLTQNYDRNCRGSDDDDDSWHGGKYAEEYIREFEQLPQPAVERTHGRGNKKTEPTPDPKNLPKVLPVPTPLPEFPLPFEWPIVIF